MESNENNWTLGEIANLPRTENEIKSGFTSYVHYISSRYICVREATDMQRGILVKVLGKAYRDQVKIVDGKPFGRDARQSQRHVLGARDCPQCLPEEDSADLR